ncbi:NAD(P)-dependent oxidoreductase [Gammaproteobacteria bacterium]|nr:NAD(P)-dependent oxidoreductase [Gammaproteobacteria bacterium]MDC3306809.1 NAD(P)-dependent oxidoreductase [Gammaproteobacteria bacterium]
MSANEKKVLVTGHNGFIGRHLCSGLLASGFSVVGIGRGSYYDTKEKLLSYEVDILNRTAVSKIILDYSPEIIIHLAGGPARGKSYNDFHDCVDTAQRGSYNIIDAALKLTELEKFIFLGSCEEYGCIDVPFVESSQELPNTAYGLAKLSISRYLQTLSRIYDFPATILRPSVVYGPGQSKKMFLSDLITHLLNNQTFDMSEGLQTREFVFIEDLVRAILLAISAEGCKGEIINISSCSPVLIKDVAREVGAQIQKSGIDLINYGAKDYRVGESMKYYADNSKAKILLGWSPEISLTEGVQRTIEWKRQTMENLL